MTRKDYILIAEALLDASTHAGHIGNDASMLALTAKCIAQRLAEDNPRFGRDFFLQVVRGEKPLNSRPPRRSTSCAIMEA